MSVQIDVKSDSLGKNVKSRVNVTMAPIVRIFFLFLVLSFLMDK